MICTCEASKPVKPVKVKRDKPVKAKRDKKARSAKQLAAQEQFKLRVIAAKKLRAENPGMTVPASMKAAKI